MERLSNYAAASADVSCLYAALQAMLSYFADYGSFFQVLPEFLQVEAFAKLSSAIGKVKLLRSGRILLFMQCYIYSGRTCDWCKFVAKAYHLARV